MKKAAIKIHKSIDGKKTTGVSVAYMIFQAVMLAKPDLISPSLENVIEYSLGSGLLMTLGHKLWKITAKQREASWNWIKSLKRAKNNIKK